MLLYPHAKVNLSLFITGRRPDGYHELDSVFLPLGLCDRLEIVPAEELSFSCSVPELETESNLVLKAWRLMAERFGIGPAAIRLQKRIPSQAGLGGGSADAAAALRGLNELFQTGCTPEQLAVLGAGLGADVPAQLWDVPVRGRGNGGEICPWGPAPAYSFVLLKPAEGFSTPAMYRAWDAAAEAAGPADGREPERWQKELKEALESGDPVRLAACLHNDFEAVLPVREKKIVRQAGAILKKSGCLRTLLCGSGSTVLGLFENETLRDRAAEEMTEQIPAGWSAYACNSLSEAEKLC